jgi:putative FmdB family regulatory protein
MPTYEYECDACGEKFEKFQSITSKPIRKCPACGRNKVRRLLGVGAGVIFKGSGFYCTDYRSDSYKQAASKEASGTAPKADSSPTKSDSATKSDSKPAKKTK